MDTLSIIINYYRVLINNYTYRPQLSIWVGMGWYVPMLPMNFLVQSSICNELMALVKG